jgi:tetratricopeptide (TPR) repeat protein
LRRSVLQAKIQYGDSLVKRALKNRLVLFLPLSFSVLTLPVPAQNDRRQAAMSLEQQGRIPEAETEWKDLSKKFPSNPEPFAHLGLLEARQEHFTEAIGFYRTAMALYPAMPGLRLNLGLALFKNGDYKHALQEFEPLVKTHPEEERLVVLMGMSHYGLGEYAEAAPYLKQASERDSQNLALLLTLAHSCLLSRQYQCVLDAFHRIVALNSESAEADMLVGEAMDEMHETIAATREFRAAVAANPKEPNVHFGLGYLLWTQSQYAEAAQQFQAEISNDPAHQQAMRYLADSQVRMNQFDDAQTLLEKLVKVSPNNSMEHLDLGIVYTEQGRKQDALAEFKAAAKLSPSDVNAHWRMGRLYGAMGKKTEAKVEFDKANGLNKAADEHLVQVMSRIPGAENGANTGSRAPREK